MPETPAPAGKAAAKSGASATVGSRTDLLSARKALIPRLPLVNALAIERYSNDRNPFRQYYDYDLVASTEARLNWVPPNLRDFD